MALQDASAHKTTTDNAVITSDPIYDDEVMTAIEAKLTIEAARTDIKTYCMTMTFNAIINGRTDPIEIVQSGDNITLTAALNALGVKNYRTSYRSKKAAREGGQDRLTLTIAWD